MDNTRTYSLIGMFIGGYLGNSLPALWDAGSFSFSAVVCAGLGSFVGLIIAFKLSQQ